MHQTITESRVFRYGPNGTETPPNDDLFYTHCQLVPDLQTTFQWGRQDCDTAPYSVTDVGFPAATLGYDGVTTFFADNFGFSVNETTALMGAHTLGRVDIFNSGFHGTWVNGEGVTK